jgi:hypothetical protein
MRYGDLRELHQPGQMSEFCPGDLAEAPAHGQAIVPWLCLRRGPSGAGCWLLSFSLGIHVKAVPLPGPAERVFFIAT